MTRPECPNAPVFFYGSLRDPELLAAVLGSAVAPERLVEARAPGYATRCLADEAYPVLVPAPGAHAEGCALLQLSEEEFDRLSFFEEAEYGLAPIKLETEQGPMEAVYFRATEKARLTDRDWDFNRWAERDRAMLLAATWELMHLYGSIPIEEIDRFWPGILRRANLKARSGTADPPPRRLGTGFTRQDIEIVETERLYTGFVALNGHLLRHRRFDGGWTETLDRLSIEWGEAATVLPYDPVRDRVLLIEQFRVGPAIRGDANPWCVEVIAGLIEGGESAEDTVRREVVEESGITLGRLVPIASFSPSPATCCERVTSFVGEADLSGEGGRFGLAAEGEDIRSIICPVEDAMAALQSGEIHAGPAVISLLWLQANRERVRRDWLGGSGSAVRK